MRRTEKIALVVFDHAVDVLVLDPDVFTSTLFLDLRHDLVDDDHGDAVEKRGHVRATALLAPMVRHEPLRGAPAHGTGVVIFANEDFDSLVCNRAGYLDAVGGVADDAVVDGHVHALRSERMHHLLLGRHDEFPHRLEAYSAEQIKPLLRDLVFASVSTQERADGASRHNHI